MEEKDVIDSYHFSTHGIVPTDGSHSGPIAGYHLFCDFFDSTPSEGELAEAGPRANRILAIAASQRKASDRGGGR